MSYSRADGYHEISGDDIVLDLISAIELPDGFPESAQPGFGYGSLKREGSVIVAFLSFFFLTYIVLCN